MISTITIYWVSCVLVGAYISHKRKYYPKIMEEGPDGVYLAIVLNILLCPLALVIALVREFIIKDWYE